MVARICVPVSTVNVEAEVPLNSTSLTCRKCSPVIVTSVATGASPGVNELISGIRTMLKKELVLLVPEALVKLIFPVVAPVDTVARICVSESMVNEEAGVPPKETSVVPVKNLVPEMVTSVPIVPWVGVKESITGTFEGREM